MEAQRWRRGIEGKRERGRTARPERGRETVLRAFFVTPLQGALIAVACRASFVCSSLYVQKKKKNEKETEVSSRERRLKRRDKGGKDKICPLPLAFIFTIRNSLSFSKLFPPSFHLPLSRIMAFSMRVASATTMTATAAASRRAAAAAPRGSTIIVRAASADAATKTAAAGTYNRVKVRFVLILSLLDSN